jgi:hypothetical protein
MLEYSDLGYGGALSLVVIGVTNVIKPIVPERFHPLVSLVLGLSLGGGVMLAGGKGLEQSIVGGIILGLTAAGMYDHKSVVRGY